MLAKLRENNKNNNRIKYRKSDFFREQHAWVVPPESRHHHARTAWAPDASFVCKFPRTFLHQFQQWSQFLHSHRESCSSVDRTPETIYLQLEKQTIVITSSLTSSSYMQMPTQFTIITHFYVDSFI